ncbi:MAG: type II restriction endonuclease [Kiritimatiellae bacterium]|nr:type II restriction endonuclease [Kiritimatiellia bacterium]
MKDEALMAKERKAFHKALVSKSILTIGENGVASNADGSNRPSREIAAFVAKRLGAKKGAKLPPQSSGSLFEAEVCSFIKATFPKMRHLRPGKWHVMHLGNSNPVKTASFAQYEHLAHLAKVLNADKELVAMLGNDYMVTPDIVIARGTCEDVEINETSRFVDAHVSLCSDLRKSYNPLPLMHASISAKWTMRSDRAQNSRTEALNLIRNRKGHLPHIVVVTGEPLPSRLASLALGTGDLDCVYHFALYELMDAVKQYGADGREDIIDQLESLVNGKRLKDISDLPLDLCC